ITIRKVSSSSTTSTCIRSLFRELTSGPRSPDGEPDRKCRATPTPRASQRDAALVLCDDRVAQCQADPGAFSDCFRCVEEIEDLRQILRRHASSRVLDGDHCLRPCFMHGDLDAPWTLECIKRIGQHIDQYLPHQHDIGGHSYWSCWGLYVDTLTWTDLLPDDPDGVLDQRVHVDLPQSEALFARILKQVIDDARGAPQLGVGASKKFGAPHLHSAGGLAEFREARNRVLQRISQFVAEPRGKPSN